jgi:hypothetical protein
MKPGDLVKLYESNPNVEHFTVGCLDSDGSWNVDAGTLALVVKILPNRSDGVVCHILIDGKMGWAYKDDCEVIDETR